MPPTLSPVCQLGLALDCCMEVSVNNPTDRYFRAWLARVDDTEPPGSGAGGAVSPRGPGPGPGSGPDPGLASKMQGQEEGPEVGDSSQPTSSNSVSGWWHLMNPDCVCVGGGGGLRAC